MVFVVWSLSGFLPFTLHYVGKTWWKALNIIDVNIEPTMSLNGFRYMQTPKFTITPDFSRLECIVQLICVLCCNSSDLAFLLPLLILALRYFLLCVNYFFYGETVTDYFSNLVQREEPLRILSKYHRLISFAMYLTGEAVAQVLISFHSLCFPSWSLIWSGRIYGNRSSAFREYWVRGEGGRRAVLFNF